MHENFPHVTLPEYGLHIMCTYVCTYLVNVLCNLLMDDNINEFGTWVSRFPFNISCSVGNAGRTRCYVCPHQINGAGPLIFCPANKLRCTVSGFLKLHIFVSTHLGLSFS